ncbi:MAG: histidine triad nucleotide-binding protein [Candidatus Thiodiazotropha sp. (ex Ctena orbiculata)]|uniref:Histidine triad nucleotide-binding protein n=1 Tax=Candidatus Thiodiazotropha taylori TaxID=2792791 RepID=A0A944QW14_9GAMM|nr:histidine triad nucleotide-binding protein [Candidatus Thiodiazotropha taylori]PVV13908.1 MAG: histidine triad nucleotide-binding protein [gamma proteobacterium symbiont of Ctena orbiculata]MBT2990620.1 histidine triad nucleotide-binding protein [Candidatus Thiodiazotropha taylori]MBT2998867.1 histidine triad nucleotide-binding protein [Candidatus Thiodiazotropha taylori]MBT3002815.1 histidine triad nucleotide-binding protein [Candidatus Thiodiazotropha taylori]
MSDCLFCKFVNAEIEPDKVYEDDDLLAFRDINPQAPTHILIIPKRHIATLNELEPSDQALMGKLTLAAQKIANDEGIGGGGYRLVINCNSDAGQSVFHIHMHLLGGRSMGWPPG